MGEYLPGSLQDRLVELREANGYNSQYKLAEKIGVDRSTYSRIENGDTKTISSDILIKLSEKSTRSTLLKLMIILFIK